MIKIRIFFRIIVSCSINNGVITKKNHIEKSIEYVHKKLLKFVSIFYKLRHEVNPQILQTVYFSFIHPHLLYGIVLFKGFNDIK